MKYFLTGGAGFIGSHLSEELLEQGHSVSILDDLSTGSIENIAHLKSHPKFQYVIGSVTEKRLTAELIDGADAIYHLAAAVGVKLIVESPVRTMETNIRGTEVVLEIAAKKSKPVFVASTSEVYGKSLALPFREDGELVLGSTTKGRWSYACSKAIDEFMALAYFREKKLPTVVGRLFNTVGPRQTGKYGMVLPTFVRQALRNEPVTVYGDGTQSRCFCHVKDTVRALAAVLVREDAYGQVFNLGNDEEVTVMQLAERVIARTGSSSTIKLLAYDEAYEVGFEDMHRRIPSLEKTKAFLSWTPTRNLDTIIDDVIAFERAALG